MREFSNLPVTRHGKTLFVPLPVSAQSPISGGCSCSFCTKHPDRKPMWDTLAIAADRPDHDRDTTWTVHFPEAHSK